MKVCARALRASIFVAFLGAYAFASAARPDAEGIARAHVKALNTATPAAIGKWIQTYCAFDGGGWDKGILKAAKDLRPVTFEKIEFSAPYEFIAKVIDGKKRTDHITFFLNSDGKVRYVLTYPDKS